MTVRLAAATCALGLSGLGRRLLVINDNNYPFSAGRNPSLPDDSEFVILRPVGRSHR